MRHRPNPVSDLTSTPSTAQHKKISRNEKDIFGMSKISYPCRVRNIYTIILKEEHY